MESFMLLSLKKKKTPSALVSASHVSKRGRNCFPRTAFAENMGKLAGERNFWH